MPKIKKKILITSAFVSCCILSIAYWFFFQEEGVAESGKVVETKEGISEPRLIVEETSLVDIGSEVKDKEQLSPSFNISKKSLALTRPMEIFLDNLRMQYPQGKLRQEALYNKLSTLSPEEIFELLQLSFPDATLGDVTHVLLEQYAALEPEAVLEFARDKEFGLEPAWWHSVIGGLEEPNIVLGDLEGLGYSYKQSAFVGHVMNRWAEQDGQAALDYAVQVENEAGQNIAIANVIVGVSRTDHAEGLKLAQAYHNEIDDPTLIESVAVDWAANDLESARNEILAMPDGDEKQGALVGLAKVTVSKDVNTAFSLIEQVDDLESRRKLYIAAAVKLYTQQPTAGEHWLTSTSVLSAKDQQYVRDFYRYSRQKRP